MPITLAQARGRVVERDLELESEALFGDARPTIHLRYRPGALTPKFESELRAYGQDSAGFAALVVGLVEAWDLEGEDGKPFPLEQEKLLELPAPFLAAVVMAIRKDIAPGEPIAETSVDGSSPTAESAGLPTGTSSFAPADTPASPPGN